MKDNNIIELELFGQIRCKLKYNIYEVERYKLGLCPLFSDSRVTVWSIVYWWIIDNNGGSLANKNIP